MAMSSPHSTLDKTKLNPIRTRLFSTHAGRESTQAPIKNYSWVLSWNKCRVWEYSRDCQTTTWEYSRACQTTTWEYSSTRQTTTRDGLSLTVYHLLGVQYQPGKVRIGYTDPNCSWSYWSLPDTVGWRLPRRSLHRAGRGTHLVRPDWPTSGR